MIGPIDSTGRFQIRDLDLDGDYGVVASGAELALFENDGSETFTKHILSPNRHTGLYSDDRDRDGEFDLISVINRRMAKLQT